MKRFEAVWNGKGLSLGPRSKEFVEFAKKNPKMRYWIDPQLPESRKMRKYYHGAVLTLWAFLDGKNYRSSAVVSKYHDIVCLEYCGEVQVTKMGTYTTPGSTKKILPDILDKVIDMLEEQYGIDRKDCLDPKHYKDFRDRIYTDGEFDTYIDYLLHLNKIKKPV